MSALYQKVRPQTLDQIVGQPFAVETAASLVARGELAGQACLITGDSGSGKTTLAWCMGRMLVGDARYEGDAIREWDASDVGMEWVREYEAGMRIYGFSPNGRAVEIINEIHTLRGPIVSRLLTTLEALPQHRTWLLTTTKRPSKGLFEDFQDGNPFLSRPVQIELEPLSRHSLDVAIHVRNVARAEGLDGSDLSAYMDLGKACEWNMRQMINAVAGRKMVGKGVAHAAVA